jgi:hypothetical protein
MSMFIFIKISLIKMEHAYLTPTHHSPITRTAGPRINARKPITHWLVTILAIDSRLRSYFKPSNRSVSNRPAANRMNAMEPSRIHRPL